MRPIVVWFLLLAISGCSASLHSAPPSAGRFWIDFVFFHTVFDEDPRSAIAVTVIVTKEDPIAGFISWRGVHIERDRIGWGVENGVMTSVHRVWSPGHRRHFDVDFDTGCTIQWISGDVPISFTLAQCLCEPDPLSGSPCDGVMYTTATVRGDVVTYRDREGREHVRNLPREDAPGPGELCLLHGGRRPPRKVLPEQERRELVESTALELYQRAEMRWVSRNPKVRILAQAHYRELLRRHLSSNTVRENVARIKSRAEASMDE